MEVQKTGYFDLTLDFQLLVLQEWLTVQEVVRFHTAVSADAKKRDCFEDLLAGLKSQAFAIHEFFSLNALKWLYEKEIDTTSAGQGLNFYCSLCPDSDTAKWGIMDHEGALDRDYFKQRNRYQCTDQKVDKSKKLDDLRGQYFHSALDSLMLVAVTGHVDYACKILSPAKDRDRDKNFRCFDFDLDKPLCKRTFNFTTSNVEMNPLIYACRKSSLQVSLRFRGVIKEL